ncbi:hypothetical protein ACEYW6_36025 [Nostoc sp. UIC 10607]|uniref:hypothetical protein n=1 Tax=Nostoc sp. UIC 10607 TaxID=3045935 RepID=UPI0039A13DC1
MLQQLWHFVPEVHRDTRVVDMHISRLRRILTLCLPEEYRTWEQRDLVRLNKKGAIAKNLCRRT